MHFLWLWVTNENRSDQYASPPLLAMGGFGHPSMHDFVLGGVVLTIYGFRLYFEAEDVRRRTAMN
jgi:hypothetical protein